MKKTSVYVAIDIRCRGFDQPSVDKAFSPEEVVLDVLSDIIDQIRSGTKLADLNGDLLRVWTGQEVGDFTVHEIGPFPWSTELD